MKRSPITPSPTGPTGTQAVLHPRPASARGRGPKAVLVVAVAAVAALATLVVVDAHPASASTLNAPATISSPTTLAPLASGASTTQFTVALPANAACSGDTASNGYHVYSYLVPQGTNLSAVTFTGDNPPSVGYGLVNDIGTYYGPANTAPTTGQIIGIPTDFEWAPLVANDGVPLSSLLYTGGTSGVWEAGLACSNSTHALTDNWNTQVTFTANGSDPNGFVCQPGTWFKGPDGRPHLCQ